MAKEKSVFQELLYLIFGDDKLLKNTTYFNKTCYGEIDKDLRLKAYIDTTGHAGHYTCIRLQVINRIDGVVDKMTIHFTDIWETRDGIIPHIYTDRYDEYWRLTPNIYEMRVLCKAVNDYISVFKRCGK